MRLGIKGKQVLGVTLIVGAVAAGLSLMHLARLAGSAWTKAARAPSSSPTPSSIARGEAVLADRDPQQALKSDPGLRSILESSLYAKNVTFAAIVDTTGVAVVHADPSQEGRQLPAAGGNLEELIDERRMDAALHDLQHGGENLRAAAAAAARHHRVRLDPDRRVDAAHPQRPRPLGSATRSGRRSSRWGSRCSGRWRSRRCCCGRFTSSAAA